jgi:hypothetical protein
MPIIDDRKKSLFKSHTGPNLLLAIGKEPFEFINDIKKEGVCARHELY